MTNEYKKIDKTKSMVDIACEILETRGEPMFYKDIWEIMRDDVGYVSHGSTPENSLNAVIGRDDRFIKHQGIVELKSYSPEEMLDNIESLQQIFDEKRCPFCKRQIQENFKYCPYCMSELGSRCEKCGKELKYGWLCCPDCGPD